MTIRERAWLLRKKIEKAAQTLTDEESLEATELFPTWKPNTNYIMGNKLRHNNILYKILQSHTSQEGWEPNVTPALYAKVLIPEPDQTPEWEQPDSTNPYMAGDKVIHNGFTWESDIDNNVWEPGVYGWHKVEE